MLTRGNDYIIILSINMHPVITSNNFKTHNQLPSTRHDAGIDRVYMSFVTLVD